MPKTKHGMYGTRIYRIYRGMKNRCNNQNTPEFKYYGGRGIKICPEWDKPDGFSIFCEWAMANGYSDELSIDRIDVNKGYNPENCRWVDSVVQARNKSNNVCFDYKGKKITISEISELCGLKYSTLLERLRRKGTIDDSPLLCKRYFDYKGKLVTLPELSQLTGIKYTTLRNRVRKGYDGEELYKGLWTQSRKATVQMDKDGTEVARFESAFEASEKTGIAKSTIVMACEGKRKTGQGYLWRYVDDMSN